MLFTEIQNNQHRKPCFRSCKSRTPPQGSSTRLLGRLSLLQKEVQAWATRGLRELVHGSEPKRTQQGAPKYRSRNNHARTAPKELSTPSQKGSRDEIPCRVQGQRPWPSETFVPLELRELFLESIRILERRVILCAAARRPPAGRGLRGPFHPP